MSSHGADSEKYAYEHACSCVNASWVKGESSLSICIGFYFIPIGPPLSYITICKLPAGRTRVIHTKHITYHEQDSTRSPESIEMWFAGKRMEKDKTIDKYAGRNEKSKIIVKLQEHGDIRPTREPVSTVSLPMLKISLPAWESQNLWRRKIIQHAVLLSYFGFVKEPCMIGVTYTGHACQRHIEICLHRIIWLSDCMTLRQGFMTKKRSNTNVTSHSLPEPIGRAQSGLIRIKILQTSYEIECEFFMCSQ